MRHLIRPEAKQMWRVVTTYNALSPYPSLTPRRRGSRRPSQSLQEFRERLSERNRRAFRDALQNFGRAFSRQSRMRPLTVKERARARELELDADTLPYRGAK